LIAFGLLAGLFLDFGLAALESRLVDIAYGDDACARELAVFRHVGLAAAAQSDDRDIYLVTGSTKPRGGSCNRRGCEGEKRSSGVFRHKPDSFVQIWRGQFQPA